MGLVRALFEWQGGSSSRNLHSTPTNPSAGGGGSDELAAVGADIGSREWVSSDDSSSDDEEDEEDEEAEDEEGDEDGEEKKEEEGGGHADGQSKDGVAMNGGDATATAADADTGLSAADLSPDEEPAVRVDVGPGHLGLKLMPGFPGQGRGTGARVIGFAMVNNAQGPVQASGEVFPGMYLTHVDDFDVSRVRYDAVLAMLEQRPAGGGGGLGMPHVCTVGQVIHPAARLCSHAAVVIVGVCFSPDAMCVSAVYGSRAFVS